MNKNITGQENKQYNDEVRKPLIKEFSSTEERIIKLWAKELMPFGIRVVDDHTKGLPYDARFLVGEKLLCRMELSIVAEKQPWDFSAPFPWRKNKGFRMEGRKQQSKYDPNTYYARVHFSGMALICEPIGTFLGLKAQEIKNYVTDGYEAGGAGTLVPIYARDAEYEMYGGDWESFSLWLKGLENE